MLRNSLKAFSLILAAGFLALALHAKDEPVEKPKRTPSPKGAQVYIVSPKDGESVKAKFTVVFGLKGMGICPAGLTAAGGQPFPNTGHHHLLVNAQMLPPVDVPLVVDKPQIIKHFGMGQTEAEIELPPGKHTLQLMFADHAHVAHEPPVISKKITVTVK